MDDPNRGWRHRVDPGALIAGIFFLAVAVTHLLAVFGGVDVTGTAAVSALLGGLAVVLTIRVLTRSRRRDLP
jgi:membrane associated rhomboid family serine protease